MVKKRSYSLYGEQEESSKYQSLKESALIYTFVTCIQLYLQKVDCNSYPEADNGFGKIDFISIFF